MLSTSVDINGAIAEMLASNKNLDAFANLLKTILKSAEIQTYVVSIYDYNGTPKNLVSEGELNHGQSLTFFYQYEKDLSARITILKSAHTAYRKIEKQVSAITEIAYLKKIKSAKIDDRLMRRDLELASKMQRLLIPSQLVNCEQFKTAGYYKPHHLVGGDFYDVFWLNDHEVGFCIGDISGKGVNAAIIMSNYQALAKGIMMQENDLRVVVNRINHQMFHLTNGEKYITLFIAVYNLRDKRLVYCNCGHMPIAFYNNEDFQWLEKGATIIGAFNELKDLEFGEIHVKNKAQLLLYTDGLLNLNYDHEPLLSFKEFEYVLVNHCLGKTSQEVVDFFVKDIEHIRVEEDLKDDISILAIELN